MASWIFFVAIILQPCKESRLFPVLVVSRVIFIPLLMLCNVQGRTNLPVYFSHDAAFTAIMVLFSLSSGYFVALSMTYAPQWVQTSSYLMPNNERGGRNPPFAGRQQHLITITVKASPWPAACMLFSNAAAVGNVWLALAVMEQLNTVLIWLWEHSSWYLWDKIENKQSSCVGTNNSEKYRTGR